jgi:hypothetical protein
LASNELLEKEAPSHHFLIDVPSIGRVNATEPAELLLQPQKMLKKFDSCIDK